MNNSRDGLTCVDSRYAPWASNLVQKHCIQYFELIRRAKNSAKEVTNGVPPRASNDYACRDYSAIQNQSCIDQIVRKPCECLPLSCRQSWRSQLTLQTQRPMSRRNS